MLRQGSKAQATCNNLKSNGDDRRVRVPCDRRRQLGDVERQPTESRLETSARSPELLVPLREKVSPGPELPGSRFENAQALKPLQTMLQHRAILLPEDVQANLDHEVGPDAEDVPIKGSTVKRAECQPIGDDRFALRVAVGEDVGRLQ